MIFPKHVTEERLQKMKEQQRWKYRFKDDKTILLLYDQKAACFAVYLYDVLDWSRPQEWLWQYMTEGKDLLQLADTYESKYKENIAETALDFLAEDFEENTQALLLAVPTDTVKQHVKDDGNGYHRGGSEFRCTNPFLLPDGYCSLCGKYHNKQETRAQLERRLARESKRVETHLQAVQRKRIRMLASVNSNPVFKYAFDLACKILEDWELDAVIKFSKMNDLCFITLSSRTHVMLSYPLLEEAAEKGFGEMPRLADFTQHALLFGLEAAHQITLHACAHLICNVTGGKEYRNAHGEVFKETYKHLMKHYPYIDNSQQLHTAATAADGAAAAPAPGSVAKQSEEESWSKLTSDPYFE